MARWDSQVEAIVARCGTLVLRAARPGWDDARGYVFEADRPLLHFKVDKANLAAQPADAFEVLVWSKPRVLVVGTLAPASPEDIDRHLALLLARGWEESQARYALFDGRSKKPRPNNHVLTPVSMTVVPHDYGR